MTAGALFDPAPYEGRLFLPPAPEPGPDRARTATVEELPACVVCAGATASSDVGAVCERCERAGLRPVRMVFAWSPAAR